MQRRWFQRSGVWIGFAIVLGMELGGGGFESRGAWGQTPSKDAKDAAGKATDAAKDATGKATDAAKDAAGKATDAAGKATDAAKDVTGKAKALDGAGAVDAAKKGLQDPSSIQRDRTRVRPKVMTRGQARRSATTPDPNRLEIGGLPAVNYNIDTGFGVGVIGNLARFAPGYYPYRWRLAFQIYLTLQPTPTGVENPYHSHWIRLDMPGIIEGLRLQANLEFRRFSTAGYFGMGNNSMAREPWKEKNLDPEKQRDEYIEARRYQQYDRIYPIASVAARITTFKQERNRLELYVNAEFSYNIITVYAKSKLEEDIKESRQPTDRGKALQDLVKGIAPHALLLLSTGFLWDTRDHEFVPTKGFLNEIAFRGSPGIDGNLWFGGVNMTLRFYQSLYKEFIVLAIRVMGDMLFGNVPFYLLAEHGGFFPATSLGSGTGVRAIPSQRFHGKIKTLGNLELRFKLFSFSAGTQRFSIGLLGFFDAGRSWVDFKPYAPLFDGDGDGIKFSGGGGLRIQWGETLVVRLDVGYSNIGNLGFYLDINHIF